MSESSYADEYGRWLESSHSRIADVSEEDSCDANDGSREYPINTIYSHESEHEKSPENLPSGQDNKLSSESMNEQAPILIDDDDDDLFTTKKQHYEDEPPILEPVHNQLQSCKVSAVQNLQFSPQICMRNYSRNNKIHPKKHSPREQKICSSKDKVNLISPDLCDEPRHVKSKDSKSGNIFDKFTSENYDCPPPLIPNPETVQTCSELPSSMAKHPNHSPNFCAMEADSTSEINGDKSSSVFIPHSFSKNSAHEVSVECDSTCMLAASPIIVSPASISNSEMEETTDSGDCGNRDGEFETCAYKSKKCDNILERNTKSKDQSTLMHTVIKKCLVDEIISKDTSEATCCDKSSELQIVEKQCYPDPQKLGISTHLSNDYRSLSIDVDNDVQSNVSESCTEPPVLSAVSPPSVRSQTRFRKELIVDSPKSFSRSRKRSHAKPSEYSDATYSSPPILNCVSETAITSARGRHSRVMSEHSQDECLDHHLDKTLSSRRRRRCNSLPVTGGTDYYNTLSDNVRSFVISTSELSDLQTHMHRLLYRLFPQLKTELDSMSPESFKFESLLSDIVALLEQPDDQDNSSPPPLISCRNMKPTYIYEYPRFASFTSELNCTYQGISDEPFSTLLSTSNSQAAADYAKIVLNSDAISCSHAPSSKPSSSYQSKQRRQVKTQQKDDKDLVAPLSRLSVRDMEDILRPSKVLLCRDPRVLLEKFVKLSCRALQLLLPDLTVSVYNELGQSPRDLVAFINNVILINSRRRQKY